MEKIDFKITVWSFMILVKRNIFFKIQSLCYWTHSHKQKRVAVHGVELVYIISKKFSLTDIP